jgi:hypothetical protein
VAEIDQQLVEELARMASELTIAEQPHRTILDGEPEPVVVGHWVEVLRHCLDGLEPGRGPFEGFGERTGLDPHDDGYDDYDDDLDAPSAAGSQDRVQGASPSTIAAVLERLLPAPDAGPAARRAWSVFLLDQLAELPSCPADTAVRIIDLALSSLRAGDAIVTRGTPLDDAIDGIIASAWGGAFRSSAAAAYVRGDAATRRRLAFHLAASSTPTPLVLEDGTPSPQAVEVVEQLRARLHSDDPIEAVLAASDLLETLYRGHGHYWPDETPRQAARPSALPDELRVAIFESLLDIAEADAPAAALAGWALMWLTLAKSPAGDGRDLTERRRARIRAVIADTARDPYLRSDLAVLLAIDESRPALYGTRDWIYEWAVVADAGGVTLPPPGPPDLDLDAPDFVAVARLFMELSQEPTLRDRAGIAAAVLARMDANGSAVVEALLRRFLDPNLDADLRDEALVHLMRGGEAAVDPQVRASLVELARERTDEGDHFDRTRAFLAIVGTGDVEAMRELLGEGRMIVGYDRAFTRSLGASPDPRALELLNELALHPQPEVRADALEELGRLAQG